jgi:Zn-dependent protease/CBS domain-containing protein
MRNVQIGRLFGIPIKLDATFLLVLPLFAYLIGSRIELIVGELDGLGRAVEPSLLTGPVLPWVLGLAAALGLFAGIVLHELGHSLTAMRYGVEIESITLWIFGGIARLSEFPEDWRQELRIAIAGPIVSVLVGIGCYAIYRLIPGGNGVLSAALLFVFGYLALMNVVLAVFNMLPGFPMDGGRVLRALLARNRPYAEATQTAAEVGKGVAVLMGLLGLLAFNIILIGLAFFVYIGASAEAQQTVMKAAFEGIRVDDIMTPLDDLETVTPDVSVNALLDRMLRQRHTGYPVVDGGQVVGMVTLSDLREVDEVERDAMQVADVMTRDLLTVERRADAMSAIQELSQHDVGRLLVTDRGSVVGLLSRTDVMTAFEVIQSRAAIPRIGTGGGAPEL